MADSERGAAIPPTLGPWTLISQVGSGGMGVVYQATRPNLGERIAALKVIRPGLLDDQAVQARFAREVEVLRRVRDVHISEFIDADIAGEPAWLATAFIDGPNLRDYVTEHGPLPSAKWWELAQGLSQALAVLEVHGITHRDLKPANVIIADTGPVLIDFGIAVPEDAASLTGTGLVTGSPAWLSPEQANLHPVTPASDIFSLGSLLAFAGTGRPPFGAGAHVAMLLAIATREPDLEGLDPEQARLLATMMAKDPAQRPSARGVLQWAKGAVADPPTSPQPVVDPHAATQVVTAAEPTATAITPPVVPVSEATRIAPALAEAPAPSPVPVGPKRRGWLVPLALITLAGLVVAGFWLWPFGDGEDIAVAPQPSPTTSPTPPAGPAPPPPAPGEVARSGDFVMSPWTIENNPDGTMSVVATFTNNGAEPSGGFATAFVYADGVAIGSASAELPEIPAGGAVPVTLIGSDPWQSGDKSVTVVVD